MRSPETGTPALDRLLQGPTRLVGSTTGIFPDVVRLHDVALTSDVLDARLSGELLADDMDFTASAVISELARLDRAPPAPSSSKRPDRPARRAPGRDRRAVAAS
jgi:hypothetical protein